MQNFESNQQTIEKLITEVGPDIVLATPLGIGKPNHFLNALYQNVKNNSQLNLTILTALTLQVPKGRSFLEKSFLKPMTDRVFGNYPDLDFENDRLKGQLPKNVKIVEFYFQAGKYKNNPSIQQNYLSSNYTHVVRDLFARGVNVIAQQVVPGDIKGKRVLSLSCNSDLTKDLHDLCRQNDKKLFKVCQINPNLPFMYGEAVVAPDFFDVIVDNPTEYFPVFAPPKLSVSPADYMIGLYGSSLIKDDGEIQIGIGSLADSLVYGLCLRQENNLKYREVLDTFEINTERYPILKQWGDFDQFKVGLFAATEMIVDSFAELYKSHILKKKVYDSVVIQRLLNQGLIEEYFEDNILDLLLQQKAIHTHLTKKDVEFLKEFGIFKGHCRWDQNQILCEDGARLGTDLNDPKNHQTIKEQVLGTHLRNGAVCHGGFFLGPNSFYEFLRQLPVKERKLFRMKRISQINQLYGHEEVDRLQRSNGRFVNTCMKVTLNGSANSDALEDGTQISGVGGQYNFVAMAHELPDARSILQLRSFRTRSDGRLESNIVFNYGNCTIPRHLRDVVITEYGIADLRGQTDAEVATQLIQVADSRFQKTLINQAIRAGKLPQDFKLKPQFSNNHPASYLKKLQALQEQQLFLPFPFGTDLTEDEIVLGRALKKLKSLSVNKWNLISFLTRSILLKPQSESDKRLLKRMNLTHPMGLKQKVYRKLLLGALFKTSKAH